MPQRPNSGKQSLWLERIRLWRQSQLSVHAFCARHRLGEASFYAWRRTLRERGLIDDGPSTPTVPSAGAAAFVPVAVEGTGVSAIELVLPHDRVLRLRAGFDAELLRQLLRVLEEPSC